MRPPRFVSFALCLAALSCTPSATPELTDASYLAERALTQLNTGWCATRVLDRHAFDRSTAMLSEPSREAAWLRLEILAGAARGEGVGEALREALERERDGAATAGPYAGLAFGEVGMWTQGADDVRRVIASTAAALDVWALALPSHFDEPTWAAPLDCGPRRTLAQARAWARLRLGTLALTGQRCEEAERHFDEGLRILELAGQAPDIHGERSVSALLLNNWSEKEMHCGAPRSQALERRRQAFRWASDVGASDSLGIISAGLAFMHAEDPDADAADPEIALAAHRAVDYLGRRVRKAGAAPPPALMATLAKAIALQASYAAAVEGPLELTSSAATLAWASTVASLSEAVYTRITVHYLAARTYLARDDVAAASAAYAAMLDEITRLWSALGSTGDQRDLFAHLQAWIAMALTHAYRTDDAALAFSAMERSKDAALLSRVQQRSGSDPTAASADWRIPWPEPVTLAEAQAALSENEAVLHLDRLHGNFGTVALVATRHRAVMRSLPQGDHEARGLEWAQALAKSAPEAGALGKSLVEGLLAPVVAELATTEVDSLWVSARGALHSLPWAALPMGERDVWVDRFAISLAPSVSAVLAARRAPPPTSAGRAAPAILVDLSLFDKAAEAERFQAPGWPSPTVFARASELTAPLVAPVLVLKGHGRYDALLPAASTIQLTPGASSDGLLTLGEAARLDLSCTVAVLSACESARGEPAPGDQIDSFARAFLAAGAQSVVAPSIPVPTRASDRLNEQLYGGLTSGATVAQALRAAQQALRASGEHQAAAHWAFFTLTGDPDAVLELR